MPHHQPQATAAGKETLSLGHRYAGVCSELVGRHQMRHNSQVVYLGAAGAILAYLFSQIGVQHPAADTSFKFVHTALICFLLIVIPLAGMACALWMSYHDYFLGVLSACCQALEEGPPPGDGTGSKVPGFHTLKQGWLPRARYVRRYMDAAFVITLVIPAVPALLLTLLLIPADQSGLRYVILATQLGIFAASIWLVRHTSRKRKDFRERYSYDWLTGKVVVTPPVEPNI